MKQRPCLIFPWLWQIKLGSSVWEKSPENHQVAPAERCPCFYLPLNAYFYSLMQPLKLNSKMNSKKHNIFTLPLFLPMFFPFETWKSFQMFKVSLHLPKNLMPGNWHNQRDQGERGSSAPELPQSRGAWEHSHQDTAWNSNTPQG